MDSNHGPKWKSGKVPVTVIMISLNEGHNMEEVLDNLQGWAHEVFLVDSYSQDSTIDIALSKGVNVVQRKFKGFGNQWNFALKELPVSAPWVLKLDPDERLTDELKEEIENVIQNSDVEAYKINIRLFFMKKRLPVKLNLIRLWRKGCASMSEVTVNEHFLVKGNIASLKHDIEHHDSPDLHHWISKQNNYTTAEAKIRHQGDSFAAPPNLLSNSLSRRMWFKKYFFKIPFRYQGLFLYYYIFQGAWLAGRVGYLWCILRCTVIRIIEYKVFDMLQNNSGEVIKPLGEGKPDTRIRQYN